VSSSNGTPSTEKRPLSLAQVVDGLRQMPRSLALLRQASPRGVVGLVVLSLLGAITPVLLVWVGREIVDAVVAASTTQHAEAFELVRYWVSVEFGLAVIQLFVTRSSSMLRQRVGERLMAHVNTLILEKAVTLELSQFEDSEFYDRLTRARREAGYRPVDMVVQSTTLLQNAVGVVGYLVALVALGWWVVPVLVLASLPVFLAEVRFSAEAFRLRNWQSPDSRRMMYTEYVLATDTHAKEVQLFGLGHFFLDQYRKLAAKIIHENIRMALRRTTWGTLLGIIGTAAFYACYVFMALKAARAEVSLGELTMYALAFRQGQVGMQMVYSALGGIYEHNLYLSNLFSFLATPARASARDGGAPCETNVATAGVPCPDVAGDRGVRFDRVTFSYPGTQVPALKSVSLFLPAGETAAIVGSNGAGKTTFIKLLTGLYAPTEGRVLIDGKEVRNVEPEELRRRFAIIFQDYSRYQLTLRENVGLGSLPHLSHEERIRRAMEQGGAESLLEELRGGLDAPLGRWFAQGVELSGGQWQKIALARAFMREDADVLVLDEPTATLDPEAEYAVFERFKQLTRGRTAILISHRFSTVRLADHIYVLMGGELVEHGSHARLLELDGAYARMFRLQARGYAG
jgi:ATP-binding cassette subfamily B protein